MKDTDYVTEFALPFIDTRNYKKFIIIDDAVYYGSTFKKITRLLLSSIADKEKNLDRRPDILAMSLVVSSSINALLQKSMINGEVEDINQEIQKIDYKEESFYINSVIDYIYGQQKPYDLRRELCDKLSSSLNLSKEEKKIHLTETETLLLETKNIIVDTIKEVKYFISSLNYQSSSI